MQDGTRVKSRADWESQRRYLLDMVQYYEYGSMPVDPGNVKGTVTSTAISPDKSSLHRSVRITCGPKDSVSFTLSLDMPNRPGPFPAIIAIGAASQDGVSHGYMMVSFDQVTLAGDNLDPKKELPGYKDNDWGTLSVWAWGVHRIVDYLLTLPETDPAKIAVTGHSRNGKAALLAGALDERISLVAPNHSGAGGAASGKFGKGETVLAVATNFKYWFQWNGRYAQCGSADNLPRMPFDSHFLKAAVAPRALLVLEGSQDAHSDPWGSAQTTYAAERVYDFAGAGGKINNHYCDCGHTFDWDGLFAYADHLWSGKALPADYFKLNASYPVAANLIPWSTPTAIQNQVSRRIAPVPTSGRGGFRMDGRWLGMGWGFLRNTAPK